MLVKCLHCDKEFEKNITQIKKSPNHFCSRSCAASMNNKKRPKRTKTNKCRKCKALILSDRNKCPKCIELSKMSNDITLGEAINLKSGRPSAYNTVRARARTIAKKLGMNTCFCGYSKHVDIAHKKPIASYPLDTKLSVINDPSNLMPLCPNHHREFDTQQKLSRSC